MADTSAGFRFRFRQSGGAPTIQYITVADTAFKKGDMANLESGELDLAVTTDANLLGMINETKSGMTASTSTIAVIVDADAVYGVYDPNARLVGATLDIAGASGAQTVAASSGKEFVVYSTSSATQETLVTINRDAHAFAKAQ